MERLVSVGVLFRVSQLIFMLAAWSCLFTNYLKLLRRFPSLL